jgi:hypothetical protein
MKNPSERITDLEEEVRLLKGEVESVLGTIFGAVHRSLQGMQNAKKLTYIEKRLIWEEVTKEVVVCLANAPRLNHNVDWRLKEMDRHSRTGG